MLELCCSSIENNDLVESKDNVKDIRTCRSRDHPIIVNKYSIYLK